MLDGVVGWIRGHQGDRWVEEGKEAVREGRWAEWRSGEPLAESVD
jgi:hypothetical protein